MSTNPTYGTGVNEGLELREQPQQPQVNSNQALLANDFETSLDFNYPLLGCFQDMQTCCRVFWCPCIQVARNAKVRRHEPLQSAFFGDCCNNDCCMYCGFVCIGVGVGAGVQVGVVGNLIVGTYQYTERRRNRQFLGMQPDECKDWLFSVFCSCCALIQETRQLNEHIGVQAGPGHQRMS